MNNYRRYKGNASKTKKNTKPKNAYTLSPPPIPPPLHRVHTPHTKEIEIKYTRTIRTKHNLINEFYGADADIVEDTISVISTIQISNGMNESEEKETIYNEYISLKTKIDDILKGK